MQMLIDACRRVCSSTGKPYFLNMEYNPMLAPISYKQRKITGKLDAKNLNKTMLTVSMLVPGYPSQV